MAEFDGVLFSDLHLSEATPRLLELFDAFVDRVAGTPEVACLGDLTEYWIGRKHLRNPAGKHIFDQMARLAQPAKRAVWISGNRDFLFRPEAKRAGYIAPRNRYFGEFGGVTVALEHGDRFCTADRGYQWFRRILRALPLRMIAPFITEKASHAAVRYVRAKSMGETARKNPEHFGIQRAPVERLVFRGAKVIVCGHVHTPFSRNYQGAKDIGRLHVMSDWREDGAVVCVVRDRQFKLMRFDGDSFTEFDAPETQGVYSLEMAK
jgi:UDP-2,3-diacylglucosamine hydrolase